MKKIWTILICLFSLHPIDIIAQSGGKTVILSDSLDPYYPLALEISNAENIEIFQEQSQMNRLNPDFILWVASPGKLTEKNLAGLAQSRHEKQINIPIGIISGKKINDARYLWENRNFKPNEQFVIFNGTSESNRIAPKILKYRYNTFDTLVLNKSNFINELKNAEYLQVSLHGAPRSWFDEQSKFEIKYNELPALKKCVIQSLACNNFRPWVENSIALESINKGAILFSGFIYSPISGSKIGGYDGLNFRYTWDEFPVGTIVQIQNQASLRTYARFPHYFMFGDPRMAFNDRPPYDVYYDSTINDRRVIKLKNAKTGFLPVKISEGENYDFISISGKIKHSSNDLFFDKRIECIDLNGNKYVLFENTSDSVTIELSKTAPLLWTIKEIILDFIDTTISLHQYTGLNIILGGLFLVLMVTGFLRGRITKSHVLRGAVISLLMATLIGALCLIRWNNINITSKELDFNVFLFVIDWFLLFSGALLFLRAKSGLSKIGASAVPFLPGYLFAIVFSLIIPALEFITQIGNERIDFMKSGYPGNVMLVEAILGSLVFFIILSIIERVIKRI